MILHGLTGTRTGSEYRRRPWWQRTWCAPANVLMSGPLSTTPLMIVIVVVALVAPAIGQGDPSADETLRGLTGVNVLVEDLPVEPAAEQVGLTPATLRADIETQLREAGIHVLTDDEWQAAPGRPWLFIRVRIIRRDATSAYTYVIALTRTPAMQARLVSRRLALSDIFTGRLRDRACHSARVCGGRRNCRGRVADALMVVRTTSGGLINSERRKHLVTGDVPRNGGGVPS